ncbi:HAMP domain-containing protein [Candidatus Poribacteria bacterium]|nr:HAMP domain-containing protein [Candidatus Poribacteria bacterium]
MRRFSIQTKIVLPFLLLFVFVSILVPLITVELFVWKYSEQFTRETEGWLNVIVDTGYFLDNIKVKQAYSVEIMIFGSDYTLNSTTLTGLSDEEQNYEYLANLFELKDIKQKSEDQAANTLPITHDITLGGIPYKVFYRILPQGRYYCLLRPMDEIADAKRTLTWSMLGIAVFVIALVAFISQKIGKNLTDPIKDLVGFTTQVAEGNLDNQCEIKTQDEIGDLTVAFNQMTHDLKQSRDKLIQAERLATAGKMSASFAHEIRNPLSSMRMLSQMLMKKPDVTPEQQKSLEYILEEIERIDNIVKGLMDFARPTTLNLEQQPLPPVLQSVLALMEANLEHHQIHLVSDFSSDLTEFKFDSDKVKQAFMNVVLNGMEAMPEGGTLTVSTFKEKAAVCIQVMDTGVGISEEDIDHLFEPFFTRKDKGTGLGLANVKRILEEHNGKIEIDSTLSEGTTVTMWLPC